MPSARFIIIAHRRDKSESPSAASKLLLRQPAGISDAKIVEVAMAVRTGITCTTPIRPAPGTGWTAARSTCRPGIARAGHGRAPGVVGAGRTGELAAVFAVHASVEQAAGRSRRAAMPVP